MPADDFVDVGGVTRIPVDFDVANPPQDTNDVYPGIFEDQRTMLPGGLACETGADVYNNVWVPHLAKYQGIEPTMDEREVVPYLNAGRWIADCPNCGGAMACWDRNAYACCLGLDCGHVFKVQWQLPAVRSEVMRIVAGWPEGNRNWDAHKGETVDELKLQGVLMLGVPAVERQGLLVAENVTVPNNVTDVNEYLDSLRRARKEQ